MSETKPEIELLDPAEAAALTGGKLGRQRIWRECREGRLKHVRLGRRILIPRSALVAFLENGGTLAASGR